MAKRNIFSSWNKNSLAFWLDFTFAGRYDLNLIDGVLGCKLSYIFHLLISVTLCFIIVHRTSRYHRAFEQKLKLFQFQKRKLKLFIIFIIKKDYVYISIYLWILIHKASHSSFFLCLSFTAKNMKQILCLTVCVLFFILLISSTSSSITQRGLLNTLIIK